MGHWCGTAHDTNNAMLRHSQALLRCSPAGEDLQCTLQSTGANYWRYVDERLLVEWRDGLFHGNALSKIAAYRV